MTVIVVNSYKGKTALFSALVGNPPVLMAGIQELNSPAEPVSVAASLTEFWHA